MKKRFILLVILLFSFTIYSNVFASNSSYESYIVWKNSPISIRLPVGRERLIKFQNPVSFGMPKNFSEFLSIKNDAGILRLTALTSFSGKRVEVKDTVTGKLILLDLSSNSDKNSDESAIDILYKKPGYNEAVRNSGWVKEPSDLQGEMSFVTLTRFAEQQLYSPKRLLKNPYNIRLITSYVDHKNTIPKGQWFDGLFIDGSTHNLKWAQWYSSGYYITAVLVRNQLAEPLDLTHNITNLCGRDSGIWKSVTFFPNWQLKPRGDLSDTTVAFLISSVPFEQAVNICRNA